MSVEPHSIRVPAIAEVPGNSPVASRTIERTIGSPRLEYRVTRASHPTDLIALPTLALAVRYAWKRTGKVASRTVGGASR